MNILQVFKKIKVSVKGFLVLVFTTIFVLSGFPVGIFFNNSDPNVVDVLYNSI